MCGTPKTPAMTNPHKNAERQQEYNTRAGTMSQEMSMVDQSTPIGSLQYTQVGTRADGTPIYEATQSYTPEQQALYDELLRAQYSAGSQGANLIAQGNYGSVPDLASQASTQSAQMYQGYMKPYWEQQTNETDARLRTQGIMPGTPAYDNAMNAVRQSQAQNMMGFTAQMEPQAWSQALQQYTLPYEMASKLSQYGSPSSVTSSLYQTPTATIQPANYLGAVAARDQMAMEQYKAKVAANSAMMSGLFGMGSSVGGAAAMMFI